jgi:hypothetical protein
VIITRHLTVAGFVENAPTSVPQSSALGRGMRRVIIVIVDVIIR